MTEADAYRQYPAELLVAKPDPMQPRARAKVPAPVAPAEKGDLFQLQISPSGFSWLGNILCFCTVFLRLVMKVWSSRRRVDGAVLAAPAPVVEGAILLELLVVDVTLQGNRRPSKVARLQMIGAPRILAQLAKPKLVWAQGWNLVLSGIEASRDESGHTREVAQTWVCKLHVPENAIGFRAKALYRSGVALPKKLARESGGSRGLLAVADDYSSVLQRHATCAELRRHQISTFPEGRLIDCYIEWMSEESFELGGLQLRSSFESHPEQLERGGWLVSVDMKERELTKSETRMLR